MGYPARSVVGSGQFDTPLVRMHSAKLRMPRIASCISASLTPPLFGSRCAHAVWAVWYWESPTPNCCAVPFGIVPLLLGSGKLGTPWERMQAE